VRGLKGPTSPSFAALAWTAVAQGPNAAVDDSQLILSAIWLSVEAKVLKQRLAADEQQLGGTALSTLLGVAAVNRGFETALKKHRKTARRLASNSPNQAVDVDFLAAMPMRNAFGQSATMDDHVTAAGDTLESWLFAASQSEHKALRAWPKDLDALAVRCVSGYSMQRAHYDLAQQALWDGWALSVGESSLRWTPMDPEFAKLSAAWNVRNSSNLMNYPWVAIAAWRAASSRRRRELGLPLTVTAIKKSIQGRRHAVVGPPPIGKDPPSYLVWRKSLEGSYLSDFLDVALPRHPELSCRHLLQTWCVLQGLAEHAAEAIRRPGFRDEAAVRESALAFPKGELVSVLSTALSCERERAAQTVGFLSWGPNAYKGLWGKPLAPVPEEDVVCLVRPILSVGNPLRCAEIWLQDGGLADELTKHGRGRRFEASVRNSICEVIKENPLLNDTRCAPSQISRGNGFDEQIDLLIQIGNLLVVGEVKCLLFPSEPRERYNYMSKLRGAAEQAWRKAQRLAA
jgi:hypothetical protein